MTSPERSEFLAANRANWDARARVHAKSAFYDIERYVSDPGAISDTVAFDREVLGDVSGLDLLHLQCHIGTDTISWARLGAAATGLDFSEESLRVARDLAARTGSPARFVSAEVTTADRVLGRQFDLVYASVGVLCWIPSFEDWARAAVGCLRPGGRFYLRDGHPIKDTFDYERTDGQVVCIGDYFASGVPFRDEDGYTYSGDNTRLDAPVNYQWTHPLSTIVNTLIGNGLRIDRLDEMDWLESKNFHWMVQGDDGRWRFPDDRPRLPLQFAIVASKPADG